MNSDVATRLSPFVSQPLTQTYRQTYLVATLLDGQTIQLLPYLSLALNLTHLRRLQSLAPLRLLLQLFNCLELSRFQYQFQRRDMLYYLLI
jgi:hypothetical protein